MHLKRVLPNDIPGSIIKKGTKSSGRRNQEARLDAWLLLEYVTGVSRAFYFADPESGRRGKGGQSTKLIVLRAGHIPLQHITHQAYFMGFEFYVNQNVLVSSRTQRHWWRRLWKL